MRWHVKGAHLESGAELSDTIEARDYADLQAKLKSRKILAESIKELKPDQVTPPKSPQLIPVPPAAKPMTNGPLLVIAILLGVSILIELSSLLNQPRRKWEYLLDSPSDAMFESTMKMRGEQGWELVSARRATDSLDNAKYEMIFKRQN